MSQKLFILFAIILAIPGCATKTVCANGQESFRPVLDPADSCKVRIRQVMVGSDIKTPDSIALDTGSMNWSYGWVDGEFKDGQIVPGHIVLKPETPPPTGGGK
jgi:hypothetical protein